MVSDESMDAPTGSLRLFFKLHEQIQATAGFGAPVRNVADLNQVCPATDPIEIVIDEPSVLEHGDQVVVGSVHVADGDDARDFVPFVLEIGRGSGGAGVPEKEKEERGKRQKLFHGSNFEVEDWKSALKRAWSRSS